MTTEKLPVYTYPHRPMILGFAATEEEARAIWADDWRSYGDNDDESEATLTERKLPLLRKFGWEDLVEGDEHYDADALGGEAYAQFWSVDD